MCMTQSLLLSNVGLERVSKWITAYDLHMRIFVVGVDSYAVVVECTERAALMLDLLEG